MNIKIYEDRSYSKDYLQNEGTQYENKATTLVFDLPETIEGHETSSLNKYIVFNIEGNQNKDILTPENTYVIPNSITNLKNVKFNLYLIEPSSGQQNENLFQWISKEVALSFNNATEAKQVIVSEQQIDIFNSLLSELNSAIVEVDNIDIDVEKENTITTVTIVNKEGVEKSVQILDGQEGPAGKDGKDGSDYVITPEDYQEIANVVENQIVIPTKTSDLENNSGFIDNTTDDLINYYKKSETYNKSEIDGKVSSVYKYKGTVATYGDLPDTDLTIGDVYNVESDGSNYAWTGTEWDKLGGNVDLSNYYTKSDTDTLVNAKYAKPSRRNTKNRFSK